MIDQLQKRFLSSLAAILAKIAKADGVVTGDEVASIGAILQQSGSTSAQCLYCTRQFNLNSTVETAMVVRYADKHWMESLSTVSPLQC